MTSHQGWEVRILPASECLNVRPALLELSGTGRRSRIPRRPRGLFPLGRADLEKKATRTRSERQSLFLLYLQVLSWFFNGGKMLRER